MSLLGSELVESLIETPEKRAHLRILLCSSFDLYLRYIFFVVNGTKVTIKPFHNTIINKLEDIAFGKNKKRNLCINIPVGAGKSLIVQYFISWCYARDTSCANLYMSHSSNLIGKLSRETKDIVSHPVWERIFNAKLKKDEKSKVNWGFDGAKKRTGLMAATMSGAVTGIDAGNPNVEGFSGALIIDDPVDVGNMRYEMARQECIDFYTDKLETRRRTPTTPTILIMQRLHKDDLTGYVMDTDIENWDFVTVKAISDEGESFWPERYPIEELEKIKDVNPYKFYAQYQQDPRVAGGAVINPEWFGYYEGLKDVKFRRLFMTADTAQKTKEHNDYTVFCVWGMDSAFLYLIDMIRGKWEAPALLLEAKKLWLRWKDGLNGKLFSAMYVEDKSSGTGLIQTLRVESRIPIIALQRHIDKLTRAEDVLPTIESGRVLLPYNKSYKFNGILLSECEGFARDMSHKHDDIVDNVIDAVNIFTKGFTREDLL